MKWDNMRLENRYKHPDIFTIIGEKLNMMVKIVEDYDYPRKYTVDELQIQTKKMFMGTKFIHHTDKDEYTEDSIMYHTD